MMHQNVRTTYACGHTSHIAASVPMSPGEAEMLRALKAEHAGRPCDACRAAATKSAEVGGVDYGVPRDMQGFLK
jgi:hypothetical protein